MNIENLNGVPLDVVEIDPATAFQYMHEAGAKPDDLDPKEGEIHFVGAWGTVPTELVEPTLNERGVSKPAVMEQITGLMLCREQGKEFHFTYTDYYGAVPEEVAFRGLSRVETRLKTLPWGMSEKTMQVAEVTEVAETAAPDEPEASDVDAEVVVEVETVQKAQPVVKHDWHPRVVVPVVAYINNGDWRDY